MRNFREYDVWQDAVVLVDVVYKVLKSFPTEERFVLVPQMSRSAISIPSNIAEGASRDSEKDFRRFIIIALGSAYELETQIIIATKRMYTSERESIKLISDIQSIQKRLHGLKKRLDK